MALLILMLITPLTEGLSICVTKIDYDGPSLTLSAGFLVLPSSAQLEFQVCEDDESQSK
jgi:hypothetical protein